MFSGVDNFLKKTNEFWQTLKKSCFIFTKNLPPTFEIVYIFFLTHNQISHFQQCRSLTSQWMIFMQNADDVGSNYSSTGCSIFFKNERGCNFERAHFWPLIVKAKNTFESAFFYFAIFFQRIYNAPNVNSPLKVVKICILQNFGYTNFNFDEFSASKLYKFWF